MGQELFLSPNPKKLFYSWSWFLVLKIHLPTCPMKIMFMFSLPSSGSGEGVLLFFTGATTWAERLKTNEVKTYEVNFHMDLSWMHCESLRCHQCMACVYYIQTWEWKLTKSAFLAFLDVKNVHRNRFPSYFHSAIGVITPISAGFSCLYIA